MIKDPDRTIPHYISGELALYKYYIKFAVNTRNLDLFGGLGASPISVPSSGVYGSVQAGWIVNLDKIELRNNLDASISNVLSGSSTGLTACYGIACSSVSRGINTNNPKYLFGMGLGGGFSLGG